MGAKAYVGPLALGKRTYVITPLVETTWNIGTALG